MQAISFKKNIIANYVGQAWIALMSFAFIPVYIKFLGVEAYGLIGIFAMLQVWFSLLDIGMTPTISREMARFAGDNEQSMFVFNLLRSIEIVASAIAITASSIIWLVSDWLADNWFQFEDLTISSVAKSFSIMGFVAALRLLENIYRSSLIGLQRQVILNIALIIGATLRGFGSIGILIWISPTIEAFFIWQGCVSVLLIALLGTIVYRILPTPAKLPTFSVGVLNRVKDFAGGVAGITLLGLTLTQVDKILLSKLLSLEEFGYYSIASVVAGSLYLLINPINQAFFPKFSELIVQQEQNIVKKLYHQGSQLISVLVGSTAVMFMCFGEEILQLWTQDTLLASRVAPLLAVLAIGNLLNAFMQMPYQLQLAHGWVSLAFKVNLVSVTFLIPMVLWSSSKYGAIGATWVWVILNVAYVFVGIHFMFQKIITSEKIKWYVQDIFWPVITSLTVALLLSSFVQNLQAHLRIHISFRVLTLMSIYLILLFASTFAASQLRLKFLNSFHF